ncbi:MAG: hypothetical protein AAB943_00095 [Patescibacteria group bacterium]
MTPTTKFLIFISILAILAMPVISYAALGDPLVPCDNTPAADGTIPEAQLCGFNAFMKLINNVVYFILFGLALPISAIMFAYAGFLLLTAGGSTEALGKAKTIFTHAALGLVIAAAAWLIINTILSILGYDGVWIGFN